MSEVLAEQPLLAQVSELEKEYDWIGSATLYHKALAVIPDKDSGERGELFERWAYALHRAALQALNPGEFATKTCLSISTYENAGEAFARLGAQRGVPRNLRCEAMVAFLRSLLVKEVDEKTKLLSLSWTLTKDALKGFRESLNAEEYCRTYSQLALAACLAVRRDPDYQTRKVLMYDAVDAGEQSVKFANTLGERDEFAKAYATTACFLIGSVEFFQDQDDVARLSQRALGYWTKALELSEEATLNVLSSLLWDSENAGWGTDKALNTWKKALDYSRKTRDSLIVGGAMDSLAMHTIWRAFATEDPAERRQLSDRALQYAEETRREYSRISFVSPRGGTLWVESPEAEYHWELARQQLDVEKRSDLLEKAVEASAELLKKAVDSGYPEILFYAHHVFSKNLTFLSKTVNRPEEKRGLLEKALEHRNESIRINDRLSPFGYFNRGAFASQLADIKSELASLAENPDTKKSLLEDAAKDKEQSISLGLQEAALSERRGVLSPFVSIGRWQHEYGDLLRHLSDLGNSADYLDKAVDAYMSAAESFQKLNLTSRTAECYWKAGLSCDGLRDHLKASEKFIHASKNYQTAAEKIPQLADFYEDYTAYMQAWSNIENARYHHRRQEYSAASEFYRKAAELHETSRNWSYLKQNYEAWSFVENAEDLSRKEQSREAIEVFQRAAARFQDAKHFLQKELGRLQSPDEKLMVSKLFGAADLRHEYCSSRVLVEQAKILDKEGDGRSASEKYGQAAETLEKTTQSLESEQDRRELQLIATLCQAWRMMTRAEAEASPSLYLEGSRLFEHAKELSPDESGKLMALGHSRFCRALEAGTVFTDTKDEALHSAAVRDLESAADYYVKAGFQNYSEYARASKLFFDAYVYMDDAVKEKDYEKRAKLYTLAERMLQASADSYAKAEQPQRKEQVQKLLDRVKKERELAASLTEVLVAPAIISSTRAFSTPTPSHETAVGLERFEYAEVHARVVSRSRSPKLGESLELKIELANAGRGAAQLIKMDEVIIEGFDLIEKPESCRLEHSHIDMNGRRLEPLKTETFRLVMMPKTEGLFTFKPRIVYLDDSGRYRLNDAEPTVITVSPIVEFLVGSFVDDYLQRRLSFKEAGWRTLMEIAHSVKMPRSQVYGDARYGHTFGKPLEALVKQGIIEYRRFSGERGRGGQIIKVRVCYEKEQVSRLVDELALRPLKGSPMSVS